MTLSCDIPDDVGQWNETLSRFELDAQDIYFRPEYVSLHAQAGEGRLYIYEEAGDFWIYPMLVRPIDRIGRKLLKENWFDIESPYGYGGPTSTTLDPGFLERAHEDFDRWCGNEGLVAEFVRFHPVIGNECCASPKMERVYDRDTFSIDLQSMEPGEMSFSPRPRNKIRRARKLGVRISECQGEEAFERFRGLYMATMDRKDADTLYYFGDRYFSGLKELVKERGYLLSACQDEEWVAAGIFLRGERLLHYHLSASTRDIYVPGATNLMIYEAAKLGRKAGLISMHLGGGLTGRPDDSLASFKKSMSSDKLGFHIGKRVHNRGIYDDLREIWNREFPHLIGVYGGHALFYRYQNQS